MVVALRSVAALLLFAALVYVAVLSHFVARPGDQVAAIRSSLDWIFLLLVFVAAAVCLGLSELARRLGQLEARLAPPPKPIAGTGEKGLAPTGRPWE